MKPDKLYIPTSTINFNNILSNESISPASFYTKRNFGYKRFEKTKLNNLDNRILLYEQYPIFQIEQNEIESYPMIVEIKTESIADIIKYDNENNIYYIEETIYLNPFTTKVYFRNEIERANTLSKAEPSIETKMIPLYHDTLLLEPEDIGILVTQHFDIKDSEINYNYISKDRKINKLKGFLYSYIIAYNSSLSKEEVTIEKHIKDLKNTISAIIHSPSGKATKTQEEKLALSYKAINTVFYNLEDIASKRKEIEHEFFKEGKLEQFIKTFGDHFLPKQSYKLSPFPFGIHSELAKNEKELDLYLYQIKNVIIPYSKNRKIEINSMPSLKHQSRIEQIPGQKDFLCKLLNEYLAEAYTAEEFVHSRYEFAKSGGKIFKEELLESWEGSSSQLYINGLLKNLNEYTHFEANDVDNSTLKSFAAFCQKGDSDVERLKDFLISNEMGDFCIAFGLWGIVFGFANMPKTLTNNLFSSRDEKYVSNIYKYVFKQIHNIELEGELRLFNNSKNIIPSKINGAQELTKHQSKTDKELHKINSSSVKEMELEIENEYKNKLKLTKVGQKISDEIIQILKENNFLLDEIFYDTISKIPNVGPKKLAKIKESLNNQSKMKRGDSTQTSFYSSISKDNQIEEKPSLSYNSNLIEELECLKSADEEIINRLKDNWQFVIGEETKKAGIINFFINLCKKEGEGRSDKQTVLQGFFTEDIAKLCKEELEKKYE